MCLCWVRRVPRLRSCWVTSPQLGLKLLTKQVHFELNNAFERCLPCVLDMSFDVKQHNKVVTCYYVGSSFTSVLNQCAASCCDVEQRHNCDRQDTSQGHTST